MSIKILQITAAYKPAYIYGGPTMSVAKLCETLVKPSIVHSPSSGELIETNNEKSLSSIVHRPSFEDKSEINNEKSQPYIVHQETNNEQRTTKDVSFDLEVFTTTANGQTELNVTPNESTIVDGVKVTYFKRLTKDHTHFSPALLLALRNEILKHNRKQKAERLKQQTSTVHRLSFKETTKTNNSLSFGEGWGEEKLIIHIHAWWNLVSILSCALAKWYHVPVILSPRGMLTVYTTTRLKALQ